MRRASAASLLAALAGVLCIAAASDPAERLKDPAQEAHARRLFTEFRCVVCQNESIDDSNADLAADLRRIVRAKVAAGESDSAIRAFLVDRYGEFILLKPTVSLGNAALWFAPALIVLVGGVVFAFKARQRKDLEPVLTPEEETRLAQLAGQGRADTLPPKIGRTKSPGMTET